MSEKQPQNPTHVEVILQRYDTNKDKRLSAEEVAAIIKEYESQRESLPTEVISALKHYDSNEDGKLDLDEVERLHADVGAVRYVAYTALIARAARYLAFTSDVGEAFRPVVKPLIVRASYGVSWLYCLGDVAYESHKRSQEGMKGVDLVRFGTERATFQAVASMAIPAFMIHSQVKIVQRITNRFGVAQRWGPSVAGLALIPFLPVLLDRPAELAIEWTFHKLWPVSHHKSH